MYTLKDGWISVVVYSLGKTPEKIYGAYSSIEKADSVRDDLRNNHNVIAATVPLMVDYKPDTKGII